MHQNTKTMLNSVKNLLYRVLTMLKKKFYEIFMNFDVENTPKRTKNYKMLQNLKN